MVCDLGTKSEKVKNGFCLSLSLSLSPLPIVLGIGLEVTPLSQLKPSDDAASARILTKTSRKTLRHNHPAKPFLNA